MRAAVNALALLFAAALQAAPAAAEESPPGRGSGQAGGDRWVPSLAVISGFTAQTWEGSVSSEICRECFFSDSMPNIEPLRDPVTSDDLAVTPYVGASLELMTPELPIRASPRLFIAGEILGTFGDERSVALEGDPGTIESPLPEDAINSPFGEDSALGQGSKTSAEIDSVAYGLHAGIAFPFELFDRPFRLKHSVAWIRYDIDVKGAVADAECRQGLGASTQCNPKAPPTGFLRAIELEGDGSDTFDGIGAGLDLEMDTGRFGPLGTSLFLGGRFYRILGNRKIEFGDSQSFADSGLPGLGAAETRARWSFEMDEWMYRIGLGFRVQWLGSD